MRYMSIAFIRKNTIIFKSCHQLFTQTFPIPIQYVEYYEMKSNNDLKQIPYVVLLFTHKKVTCVYCYKSRLCPTILFA